MWRKIIGLLLMLFSLPLWANLKIVAAENFYGQLAQDIGQNHVTVQSILNNPNQDPHLFTADFGTARAVSEADVVIYNGLDYDPWMEKLISASKNSTRKVLVMSEFVPGATNPHLWYNPGAMPLMAKALTRVLIQLDPQNQKDYEAGLSQYLSTYQPLLDKVKTLRGIYQGVSITATEPLFGYMAEALGLNMLNQTFQWQVMNEASLTPGEMAAFERSLTSHAARVLIYNKQVSDPVTEHLKALAEEKNIPVVGVTEMEPANTAYITWMMGQLNALDQALGDEHVRH